MSTHRRAGRWARAVVVGCLVATTACSQHVSQPAPGPGSTAPSAGASSPPGSASPQQPIGVRVRGLPAGRHVDVADTDVGSWPDPATSHQSTPAPSGSLGVGLGSHVYSLTPSGGTPSGALPQPARVQLTLTRPVPSGRAVLMVTRESPSRPWAYLPATLESGRTRVDFTTSQLGLFAALLVDPHVLFAQFSESFVDGLDPGQTTTSKARKPSCSGGSRARGEGFGVTSATARAVFWCFGYDAEAGGQRRVLKVVNRRDHYLMLSHRNMAVLETTHDRRVAAKLRGLSQQHVLVEPRATVTLNADLQPGQSEEVRTEMNRFGQSLATLQAGVGALLSVLTRSGAGGDLRAADVVDKMLSVATCADALSTGARGLAKGCFSSAALVAGFGSAGLLLAPVIRAGGVADLFASERGTINDAFQHHDAFSVAIHRKSASFSAFRGTWYAHTSDVVVSASGHVTESVGEGCCDPVIDLEYQLTNPRKTGQGWVADARVTKVALHDFTGAHPPRVGRTYSVRVVGPHYYGVAFPDFHFCSDDMVNADCGA